MTEERAPYQATSGEYTPTPADEALQLTLLTGHACLSIQHEYASGNIADLAAYNRLYEEARRVDGQARKLFDLLERQAKTVGKPQSSNVVDSEAK